MKLSIKRFKKMIEEGKILIEVPNYKRNYVLFMIGGLIIGFVIGIFI